MATETQDDSGTGLLAGLREAFERRDWDETIALYEKMRDMFKGQRSLRVEATCLAARALVARHDRSGARAILKPIAQADYPKAVHYDFLARAFLDLKNYREVARVCDRAAALVEAEKQG